MVMLRAFFCYMLMGKANQRLVMCSWSLSYAPSQAFWSHTLCNTRREPRNEATINNCVNKMSIHHTSSSNGKSCEVDNHLPNKPCSLYKVASCLLYSGTEVNEGKLEFYKCPSWSTVVLHM